MAEDLSEEARGSNIWTSLWPHTPSAKTVVPGPPCGTIPWGQIHIISSYEWHPLELCSTQRVQPHTARSLDGHPFLPLA